MCINVTRATATALAVAVAVEEATEDRESFVAKREIWAALSAAQIKYDMVDVTTSRVHHKDETVAAAAVSVLKNDNWHHMPVITWEIGTQGEVSLLGYEEFIEEFARFLDD